MNDINKKIGLNALLRRSSPGSGAKVEQNDEKSKALKEKGAAAEKRIV